MSCCFQASDEKVKVVEEHTEVTRQLRTVTADLAAATVQLEDCVEVESKAQEHVRCSLQYWCVIADTPRVIVYEFVLQLMNTMSRAGYCYQ
jgi:hypothetical protein